MTKLGRDAPLTTAAGPYPAGLQAFHYSSEYATHADDVAAPVAAGEELGRTAWRVSFGRFALTEQAPVKTWTSSKIWVQEPPPAPSECVAPAKRIGNSSYYALKSCGIESEAFSAEPIYRSSFVGFTPRRWPNRSPSWTPRRGRAVTMWWVIHCTHQIDHA